MSEPRKATSHGAALPADAEAPAGAAVDVPGLHAEADARARRRPRAHFSGTVIDARRGVVPVRLYLPSSACGTGTVYFAHGGYGLFGTFDLQDCLCRRLADGLGMLSLIHI